MEISFSLSDPKSYQKYINLIDRFLKAYDMENQKDTDMDFDNCHSEYTWSCLYTMLILRLYFLAFGEVVFDIWGGPGVSK